MSHINERWIVIDGSIYTEAQYQRMAPVGGTIKYRPAIAFNVGETAEHIVGLHNASLSMSEQRAARLSEEAISAVVTLKALGYTHEGGEQWNPPLGQPDPCLAKREPGEPMFTLLGRDPFAMSLVKLWSVARRSYPGKVTAPERIVEANSRAVDLGRWYVTNRTDAGTLPDVLDHVPAHILALTATRDAEAVLIADCSDAARRAAAKQAPRVNPADGMSREP